MDYTNVCIQIEQWCVELNNASTEVRDRATQHMMMFRESQYPYEVCLQLLSRRKHDMVCIHAQLAYKSAFLREIGGALTSTLCRQLVQQLLEQYACAAPYSALVISNYAHVLSVMYKRQFPVSRENLPRYIYINSEDTVEEYAEHVFLHIVALLQHCRVHHTALGLGIVSNQQQEMDPETYSELNLPLLFHSQVKDSMELLLLPRLASGLVRGAAEAGPELVRLYQQSIENMLLCVSSNGGSQMPGAQDVMQLLQSVRRWLLQTPDSTLICCRVLTTFAEVPPKKLHGLTTTCLGEILSTLLLALQRCIMESRVSPVEVFAETLMEITNCVNILSKNYHDFVTIHQNQQVPIPFPPECLEVLKDVQPGYSEHSSFGGFGIIGILVSIVLRPSVFIQYGDDGVSTWGTVVWTTLIECLSRCISVSPPNCTLQDDICNATAAKYISIRLDAAAHSVQQSLQLEEDDDNTPEENVLLKENDTSVALLIQYTSARSQPVLRDLLSRESERLQHLQGEMASADNASIERAFALSQERMYVLLDILSLVLSEYAGNTVIEGSLPPFVLQRAGAELTHVVQNIFALVSLFSANIQNHFLQRIHDELAVNTASPFVTRFLLKMAQNVITTYFAYPAPHLLPAPLQAQSSEGQGVASNILELVMTVLVCCGDDSSLCHDACNVLYSLINIPSLSTYLLQLETMRYILVFYKLACFSQNVMSSIIPTLFSLEELPLILRQSLNSVALKDVPMVLATRTNMDNPTLMQYTKILATACKYGHIPAQDALLQVLTRRVEVLSAHPFCRQLSTSEYDQQKCLEQLLTTLYVVHAVAEELLTAPSSAVMHGLLQRPLAFFNQIVLNTGGSSQTIVLVLTRVYDTLLQYIHKYQFLVTLQMTSLSTKFLHIVLRPDIYSRLSSSVVDYGLDIQRIYDSDLDERFNLADLIVLFTHALQSLAGLCTSPMEKILSSAEYPLLSGDIMEFIDTELLAESTIASGARKLELQKSVLGTRIVLLTQSLWRQSAAFQLPEHSSVFSQSLALVYTLVHDSHKYELLVDAQSAGVLEPLSQQLDLGLQSGVSTIRQNACSTLHSFLALHNFILHGLASVALGIEKAKNPISKLVARLYDELPSGSVGIFLSARRPIESLSNEPMYVHINPNVQVLYDGSTFKHLLLGSDPLAWNQRIYVAQRQLTTLNIALQQCLFEKYAKLHIDEVTCLYDLLLACKYWDIISLSLAQTQTFGMQHILQNYAQLQQSRSILIDNNDLQSFSLWTPPAVQQSQEEPLMGTRVITSVINTLITTNTHIPQHNIQIIGNHIYKALEQIRIFERVQDVTSYLQEIKQQDIDRIYEIFKDLKDVLQTLIHSK